MRLLCLAGLAALGGCASAANIGLPSNEVIAAAAQAESQGAAQTNLASGEQPIALTNQQPATTASTAVLPPPPTAYAQGDADPEAGDPPLADDGSILPWPSINRWPADQAENRLMTAEEVEETQQSLKDRAAQQLRQTFELMTLKRQRQAASDMISNAAERTRNVLAGIANKCRTDQPDEACPDEAAGEPGAAASQ